MSKKKYKNIANTSGKSASQVLSGLKANDFVYIDKAWAELGRIHIITKDGQASSMDLQTATGRLMMLRGMLSKTNKDHNASIQRCLNRLVPIALEAKHQLMNPADERAEALQNFYGNKDKDGKDLGVNEQTPEDAVIHENWKIMYPTFDEMELRAIFRNKDMNLQEKEAMLKALDHERINEAKIVHEGGALTSTDEAMYHIKNQKSAKQFRR